MASVRTSLQSTIRRLGHVSTTPLRHLRSARSVVCHPHACQHHHSATTSATTTLNTFSAHHVPSKRTFLHGSSFSRTFHLSVRHLDRKQSPSSTPSSSTFDPDNKKLSHAKVEHDEQQQEENDDDDDHIQHQHQNPIPPNTDPKARMLIGFTCTVCQHRSHKTMSKHAYNHGVVIMQCDHCKNRHLIADHLGWFKNGGVTVEDLVKAKGETVQKLTRDYQLIKDGGGGSDPSEHTSDSTTATTTTTTTAAAAATAPKQKTEFELALEKAGEGMLEWVPKNVFDQEAAKVKKSQEVVDQSLKKE